jgi:hypothetical protein
LIRSRNSVAIRMPDPRSPIPAVFYCHWLELRIPLWIMCSVVLIAAVGYGFAVVGAAGYFATSGRLTSEVARYEAIRQMGAGPALIPAAVHALLAAFFGLWSSASFVGGGFGGAAGARQNSSRHPSAYFTASLPLSRAAVQLTRLAAGFGGLLAVLGLSLVFHVIVLLVIQQPIPIAAMAGTTLMAAVGGLGLMASVGLVTAISSGVLSGLVMFGVVMTFWLTDAGWNRTLDFVRPRASVFGAAVLSASAMAALSVAWTRRKDL